MKLLPRIVFCIFAMMSVAPHGGCQTGSISGTVTVAGTGEPVKEGNVYFAQRTGIEGIRFFTSIVNGNYTTSPRLPDGDYMVIAESAHNGPISYLIQVYNGAHCSNDCIEKATLVNIKNGSTQTGINFQMQPGGAIKGQLQGSSLMQDMATVVAINTTTADKYTTFAFAQDNYSYEFLGILPGTYYILAYNFKEGFSPVLYGDFACAIPNELRDRPCLVNGATPIQIDTFSNVENINVTLTTGGKIGGVVLDAKTKKPIERAYVYITNAEYSEIRQSVSVLTDNKGQYSFTNVFPEGDYFIKVQASSKYEYELYDNIYCKDATCDMTKGTPIHITPNQTFTANVDLSPVSGSGHSAGKPDLKGAISATKRGKNVKITVQVQNSGTASSEPCDVVLFFSKKTSLSSKEVAVATFSLSTLKAKGKKTLTTTVPIQKGKSYVIASIDYNKVVSERNERNNLVNQRIR